MQLSSENINKSLIGRTVSLQIGENPNSGYITNVDQKFGWSHLNINLDKPHYFGPGYGSTKEISCVVGPNEDAPHKLTLK